MGRLKVEAFNCERCGHVWVPRNKEKEPQVCPECKSPYWNIPKKKPK